MLVIGGAGFPLGPLFGVAFVNRPASRTIIPWTLIRSTGSAVLPTLLPFLQPRSTSPRRSTPLLFGSGCWSCSWSSSRAGWRYRWEILKISLEDPARIRY
jgi:hypothetical protein